MITLESLSKENGGVILDGIEVISNAFWGPTPSVCEEIAKPDYVKPFKGLSKAVEGIGEPLAALQNCIASMPDPDAIFQHLEACYVKLFINSRTGNIAPLYASCHAGNEVDGQRPQLMGRDAIEMRQRINKMGLEMTGPSNEPPDHISIELEFLYYLLSRGWAEKDKRLLSEARTFADEAMLPWVSRFKQRIAGEKECRFYPLMAQLTVSILAYLGKHGPSPPGRR